LGVISSWAAGKGISLAEHSLKSWLEIPSEGTLLMNEVDDISSKLDSLIRSPFEQALLYLREGNISKCHEKLIEAMGHNELDLPARLLYIKILLLRKRYILALDQYWDLLERFGPRSDNLVPPALSTAYGEKILECKLTSTPPSWRALSIGYAPAEAFCSSSGIVVTWEEMEEPQWWQRAFAVPLNSIFGQTSRIEAYTWGGKQILSNHPKRGRPSIKAVTTRYATWSLPNTDAAECVVYRLSDGVQMPGKLDAAKAKALFALPDWYVARARVHWDIQRVANTSRFSNAKLQSARWKDLF
jgi:hypothetical protein